jgi:DNA-binding transcriptional MerR regulator
VTRQPDKLEPRSAGMLTIGQLAEYVGVTVRAIRHYHQRGLLGEPARDASGYRRYGAPAVLDLLRIKTLSEAGVPLARIDELLAAGPEQLAASVTEIGAALQRQIREPQLRRRRIAGLVDGERMFLPPELVAFLDELRAAGVNEHTVQVERDGWILLMARYPQQALEWLVHKRADLADPEFRRLYRGYGEAADWDPADPRLEQLADAMASYVVRRYRNEDDIPDMKIDDPTVAALLSSHFGDTTSPALERLNELTKEKLQGHQSHQQALDPGSP